MHAFEEILDSSSALRVVDITQLRSLTLHGQYTDIRSTGYISLSEQEYLNTLRG